MTSYFFFETFPISARSFSSTETFTSASAMYSVMFDILPVSLLYLSS